MAKVPAPAPARENSVESGVSRDAEIDPELSALVGQQRQNLRTAAQNPQMDATVVQQPAATPELDSQAKDFANRRRADLKPSAPLQSWSRQTLRHVCLQPASVSVYAWSGKRWA